ncbi:MFS transporter [Francisella tularensis subsp. holarctica]|nr:MFS transporter [Francisella tularensis subsp. holarctica]NCI30787.1 MFS transporter [Francisella tularensis subsp. holarctica]NDI51963.1 MFS transporter [Francisella tularensis subsp. holarctica]NDI52178.1 MFS transporter [Francisella tularensis subsp. holarctica]NDI57102.1 MFS transporter [Francisella tularensis subsp. holarctica]
MYEFLLRTILGTFEHQIIADLDLSILTFSILSSTAYQLTYGVMQIPVGIITDKLGLKKALTLAILVCALGVGLFGLCNSFVAALIYRIMIGFGASFGFLCLLIAVYEWLPNRHIGLFIGLSQFIGVLRTNASCRTSRISISSWWYRLAICICCLSNYWYCSSRYNYTYS